MSNSAIWKGALPTHAETATVVVPCRAVEDDEEIVVPQGQMMVTLGKYVLTRAGSRVSTRYPTTAACAPT